MNEIQADHFKVDTQGHYYAGDHTLVEVWGARNLANPSFISDTLRDAAIAAGATVLHEHFHHFGEEQGVSGVLILAESHISIHSWPERGYAAIDIFMCGDCNPLDSVEVIKQRFLPTSIQIDNIQRGLLTAEEQVA